MSGRAYKTLREQYRYPVRALLDERLMQDFQRLMREMELTESGLARKLIREGVNRYLRKEGER
jgi:hypothetical protein